MAVACRYFTAVVMEKGDLWVFDKGASGQLGLGTDADQLLPACVGGADEVFGGQTDQVFGAKALVMVAAGNSRRCHSVSWDTATGSRGSDQHG